MSEEKLYQLALKFVAGVGDINAKQLISYIGSPEGIFKEPKAHLRKIPGIGEKTIASMKLDNALQRAEQELKACEAKNVQILFYTDPEYPGRLKLVNDGPTTLFYKGTKDLTKTKVVGIVGTRKATTYGKATTENLVESLISHDALVVSGLAYGIDIAAHRSALKQGLSTVAVLAGGLDYIYPAAHKKTAVEMIENGGIISEHPLGTIPESHFFPARNRIIAGMSDALVVVEAARKGGALITAEIAFSYDRDVFAVPGNLNSEYSAGCNKLIAEQKANIYTGIDDLEYLLNWERNGSNGPSKSSTLDLCSFPDNERKILEVLLQFKKGLLLDELSWKTQLPVNTTVSTLLQLEFSGLVKSLPGKTYALN